MGPRLRGDDELWKTMRLRDLFSDDAVMDAQAGDVAVTGLAVDSRAVKPGDLFFALAGAKTDGARFIDQAIASGAVAVAGEHLPQADRPRAVGGDAESAPRAGARRGQILSASAGRYRGRDRHQRQDLGRSLYAADLAAARACIGQHRHHRAGIAKAHRLRLADHARSDRAASPARRNRGRGRHASGDRGLVAWPRPVPARRHPHQRRRLHQSFARSHGLSSRCRALPQRKAAAVSRSGRGRWSCGDIGRS